MNRFVETTRWQDPWFRQLSPDAKLAFSYMCDNADCVGVWAADFDLATFCILGRERREFDWDSILEEFGNRIRKLRDGKIWLTRFVAFQYGELTPTCKPHLKYLKTLAEHGIEIADCYHKWNEGEPEKKDPELPLAPNGEKKRPRDLVFEALAEAQGIDIARLTSQERGRLNKAAQAIREIEPGVTPERIRAAAKAWKKKGYTTPATAATIASHWSELTPDPAAEARRAAEQQKLTEQYREYVTEHESYMDNSGAQPFPREDLTDKQFARVRELRELIEKTRRLMLEETRRKLA